MPLYNVMERGLRMPKIGTIRKGVKEPVLNQDTGKPKKYKGKIVTRPKEVPHFVFHVDAAQEEVLESVYEQLGTIKPMRLKVFLAYPETYDNWSAWMEAYNASGVLIARSDERTMTKLIDNVTNQKLIDRGLVVALPEDESTPAGQIVAGYKIGEAVPYDANYVVSVSPSGKETRMSAKGRLSVVLPESVKATKTMHHWLLLTGGYWQDIPYIEQMLADIQAAKQYASRPANTIPVILQRVPYEHKFVDENGKEHISTRHCITASLTGDFVTEMIQMYEDTPFSMQLQARTDQTPQLQAPINALPEQEETYDEIDEPDVADEMDEVLDTSVEEVVERPYPPEVFAEKFSGLKANFNQSWNEKGYEPPFSDDYQNMIAAWLNKVFDKDDEKRHRFLAGLTGSDGSVKSLTVVEAYSLRKVMGIGVWDWNAEATEVSAKEIRQFEDWILGQEMES